MNTLTDIQKAVLQQLADSRTGGVSGITIAHWSDDEVTAARGLFERGMIRPGSLMGADITDAGREALLDQPNTE